MLLTVDEFEVVFAGASVAKREKVPEPFLAMVSPYFVGYGWGMFKKRELTAADWIGLIVMIAVIHFASKGWPF